MIECRAGAESQRGRQRRCGTYWRALPLQSLPVYPGGYWAVPSTAKSTVTGRDHEQYDVACRSEIRRDRFALPRRRPAGNQWRFKLRTVVLESLKLVVRPSHPLLLRRDDHAQSLGGVVVVSNPPFQRQRYRATECGTPFSRCARGVNALYIENAIPSPVTTTDRDYDTFLRSVPSWRG